MSDSWTFAILLLGFGSTSVGMLAERTRPQRDDVILDKGECVFPMNPAFPLALVATAMLLVAISMSTRCGACCYRRRFRYEIRGGHPLRCLGMVAHVGYSMVLPAQRGAEQARETCCSRDMLLHR